MSDFQFFKTIYNLLYLSCTVWFFNDDVVSGMPSQCQGWGFRHSRLSVARMPQFTPL